MHAKLRYAVAGLAAGAVTGVLGSGGGLVLIPLLCLLCKEDDQALFPYSLGIMLPICICSLLMQHRLSSPPGGEMLPLLLGGAIGGGISALLGRHVPLAWLHRFFGCILLWSGFRCLFS